MNADAPHVDPDDAVLVARARRGDGPAMDALVLRHHETVFRVALGVLGDQDAAADVAQEAFVKAFRSLDGFRGDAAFRTWLLSITVNQAKGVLRSRGRRREVALEEAPPVADGAMDAAERVALEDEARRARALLERLPGKQRLAVRLRAEEGLSFREVGEIIGSSEGAARVNYHHGIRRLREMLEDDAGRSRGDGRIDGP